MEEEHISNSDNDNDNDNNNDNDNDGFDNDNCEVEKSGFKNLEEPKPNFEAQISTEGISQAEMGHDMAKNLKQCIFCNKYFKHDMIVPMNEKNSQDQQCWHCLFWMNYGNRKNVDGVYGFTIVEYILKCKNVHELDTCTRNTDSGGCFLCEHNLGLQITDVKDLYKLSSSTDLPDRPIEDNEDHVDLNDTYRPGKLTVSI